ncbi:hypothetical protein V2I01_03450 [Micromonospora sp. BRA006-A]|nr:hypothetical protein [Micromonospora sp. BRA006-A]
MVDLLVIGGLGVDIRVQVSALPPPVADSLLVPPIDLRIGNTGSGSRWPRTRSACGWRSSTCSVPTRPGTWCGRRWRVPRSGPRSRTRRPVPAAR